MLEVSLSEIAHVVRRRVFEHILDVYVSEASPTRYKPVDVRDTWLKSDVWNNGYCNVGDGVLTKNSIVWACLALHVHEFIVRNFARKLIS